jgi:hypothetical protein
VRPKPPRPPPHRGCARNRRAPEPTKAPAAAWRGLLIVGPRSQHLEGIKQKSLKGVFSSRPLRAGAWAAGRARRVNDQPLGIPGVGAILVLIWCRNAVRDYGRRCCSAAARLQERPTHVALLSPTPSVHAWTRALLPRRTLRAPKARPLAKAATSRGPSGCVGAGTRCTWQSGGLVPPGVCGLR